MKQSNNRIMSSPNIFILAIVIGLGLPVWCWGQNCSELEAEVKRLKRELSVVKAEKAELLQEVQAQEVSNEFLRGKNDDLIEEVVPMRFFNNKYKKMAPRLAALENEAQKLREDSAKYVQTIGKLKDGLQVELMENQPADAVPSYKSFIINDINIKRTSKSNIDATFYLAGLTKEAVQSDEEILIKLKVYRKQGGFWEQLVYGEKGSATYDKYYRLEFCQPSEDNSIRYHSLNNFEDRKDVSEYRVEFYYEEQLIGTHNFTAFKGKI